MDDTFSMVVMKKKKEVKVIVEGKKKFFCGVFLVVDRLCRREQEINFGLSNAFV